MWRYGVLHVVLITTAYYFFGFMYGILFIIGFVLAADFILDKFGYQRLNYGDLVMSMEMENGNHNIGGYFEMQKIDFDTFKQQVYERGILHIRKLKQIQVKKFGISLWKDTDNETAKHQIRK